MTAKTERIEARFMPEVKQMAERAAMASGMTLTDYLAHLVCEDAPNRLKAHADIQLTNKQFDEFLQICDQAIEPSNRIVEAAKRLDEEGF